MNIGMKIYIIIMIVIFIVGKNEEKVKNVKKKEKNPFQGIFLFIVAILGTLWMIFLGMPVLLSGIEMCISGSSNGIASGLELLIGFPTVIVCIIVIVAIFACYILAFKSFTEGDDNSDIND